MGRDGSQIAFPVMEGGDNALLTLLIILVVLFLLFGGIGYGYRDRWGGYYTGGTGLLGLLVVIFIILLLVGAIHL